MEGPSTGTASTVTPPKPTTTYVVLELQDIAWHKVGEFTVPQGRADQAKQKALNELAAENPETKVFEIVAVPVSSWTPEKFEKELPPPAWKAAG